MQNILDSPPKENSALISSICTPKTILQRRRQQQEQPSYVQRYIWRSCICDMKIAIAIVRTVCKRYYTSPSLVEINQT
jgi:hypothetical protein